MIRRGRGVKVVNTRSTGRLRISVAAGRLACRACCSSRSDEIRERPIARALVEPRHADCRGQTRHDDSSEPFRGRAAELDELPSIAAVAGGELRVCLDHRRSIHRCRASSCSRSACLQFMDTSPVAAGGSRLDRRCRTGSSDRPDQARLGAAISRVADDDATRRKA